MDHAAAAVVLYSAANGLLAVGWILLSGATLRPVLLTKNEKSTLVMRKNHRNGYFALAIYTVCAIIAFWFPLAVALLISAIYIVWIIIGLNIKSE